MVQAHLDRLSSVDASFLHQEDVGDAHMHIGGLAILEGPAPTTQQFLDHVSSRLPLVPRYRQKVVEMPLRSGRPLWVEDPNFNLGYHVRHTALPAPGSTDQLLRLAARIVSQRLDRTRPLWELWLVEGLGDGRVAVINKTHHALVDGVGGIDLITALFDLSREARTPEQAAWTPATTPGDLELLARGAVSLTRHAVGLTGKALGLARRPVELSSRVSETAQGLGEIAWRFVDPAPRTLLNRPPGPHRRLAHVRTRLDDYKLVKNAFGGTVNDVVLACVAGALGDYLRTRDALPDKPLRACVPVSIRSGAQAGAAGNQITIMTADLPANVGDPVSRLAVVRRSMDSLKRSKQAVGAKVLTDVENFAPPTILAQASRLGFSSRLYNLLVTNVPGPQFPVYLLGRELLEIYPIAFLAPEHTLAVAIMSYNGQVNYGLIGDFDAVTDLSGLAAGIESALEELVQAARAAMGGGAGPAADAAAGGAKEASQPAAAG